MLVLEVPPGSPAEESGLESFLDLIIEVDGVPMDPNFQQGFAQRIREAENRVARLRVYSARSGQTREVRVVPRRWNGPGLFGATVQYNTVDPRGCFGIRVVDVHPQSPAAQAGLVPYKDFMLGTDQSLFYDVDDVARQVTDHLNNKMLIHTYNSETKKVRTVELVPRENWGGRGCLGCDIDTGGPAPGALNTPYQGGYSGAPSRNGSADFQARSPGMYARRSPGMDGNTRSPNNFARGGPTRQESYDDHKPGSARDSCMGLSWFTPGPRNCCGQDTV